MKHKETLFTTFYHFYPQLNYPQSLYRPKVKPVKAYTNIFANFNFIFVDNVKSMWITYL